MLLEQHKITGCMSVQLLKPELALMQESNSDVRNLIFDNLVTIVARVRNGIFGIHFCSASLPKIYIRLTQFEFRICRVGLIWLFMAGALTGKLITILTAKDNISVS
jgi:hypothetical protein